jgi:hypothetical protein
MTFDSDGMKKNMAAAAEKINAPHPKPLILLYLFFDYYILFMLNSTFLSQFFMRGS